MAHHSHSRSSGVSSPWPSLDPPNAQSRPRSGFNLTVQPMHGHIQAVNTHRLSVPILLVPHAAIRRTSYSYPAQSSPARSTPASSPRSPFPPIYFYDKNAPHYGFTNFSPHAVKYKAEVYPTSEHLFQSFKFEHRPRLAAHIRTCSRSPRVAFSEAQRFEPEKRKDWRSVSIAKMEEVLFLKFTQHEELKKELMLTGFSELIEDSPVDSFWGVGSDGKGRNELGKALMRLRDRIRQNGY